MNEAALMVVTRVLARHRAGPAWPQLTTNQRRAFLRGAEIPAAALLTELLPLLERDDVPHLFTDGDADA